MSGGRESEQSQEKTKRRGSTAEHVCGESQSGRPVLHSHYQYSVISLCGESHSGRPVLHRHYQYSVNSLCGESHSGRPVAVLCSFLEFLEPLPLLAQPPGNLALQPLHLTLDLPPPPPPPAATATALMPIVSSSDNAHRQQKRSRRAVGRLRWWRAVVGRATFDSSP